MYVSPTCMFVYYACAWCLQRPEEDIRSPELELQKVVSCHVDAGRQNLVLCKNRGS